MKFDRLDRATCGSLAITEPSAVARVPLGYSTLNFSYARYLLNNTSTTSYNIFLNDSSSTTVTPKAIALSSLEPASAPATT